MKGAKIKAVLFDLDGVLFDSKEANTTYYCGVLQSLGYKIPPRRKVYEIAMRTNLLGGIRKLIGRAPEAEIMKAYKFALTAPYPIELVKPSKGVEVAVKKLKKKYKLAIVTNSTPEGLRELFSTAKDMRLQDFDVIVADGDARRPKPYPDPLLLALKRLHMKKDEVVYIGDTNFDSKAARGAGIALIGYARLRIPGAQITINDFSKLPHAISQI